MLNHLYRGPEMGENVFLQVKYTSTENSLNVYAGHVENPLYLLYILGRCF